MTDFPGVVGGLIGRAGDRAVGGRDRQGISDRVCVNVVTDLLPFIVMVTGVTGSGNAA